MGVVSLENEYYPLVKGDRGEKGTQDQAWGFQHQEGRERRKNLQGEKEGEAERERRKTRGGWRTQGQESSVLRGKWCGGD